MEILHSSSESSLFALTNALSGSNLGNLIACALSVLLVGGIGAYGLTIILTGAAFGVARAPQLNFDSLLIITLGVSGLIWLEFIIVKGSSRFASNHCPALFGWAAPEPTE